MTDFNYKKYSLENLENWLHDAMSAGEATPQEIYDTIKKVVQEQYYYYKDGASKTDELLRLLNGHKSITFNISSIKEENMNSTNFYNSCGVGDTSDYCTNSWNNFWEDNMPPWGHSDMEAFSANKEDKIIKWRLPIEVDGPSGEYFVMFPDDLLEAANLKEGDEVEWVDKNDGTFILRKVTKPLGMDEC